MVRTDSRSYSLGWIPVGNHDDASRLGRRRVLRARRTGGPKNHNNEHAVLGFPSDWPSRKGWTGQQ